MLKQTVTYTDFDDVERTETLYFNITKSELLANLDLKERLEKSANMLKGAERELTPEEINEVVQLVKLFMRLSYGVRSEDGRRFKKNADIWEAFTETAAYDAFFMSLFTETNKAIDFLVGVVPKDLRDAAEKEMQNKAATISAAQAVAVTNPTPQPTQSEAAPSWFYPQG